MAFPTPVNDQITDAVTQGGRPAGGEPPTQALHEALGRSIALMIENAVSTQQQENVIAQAALTQGIATLYSVAAAVDGVVQAKRDGDQ